MPHGADSPPSNRLRGATVLQGDLHPGVAMSCSIADTRTDPDPATVPELLAMPLSHETLHAMLPHHSTLARSDGTRPMDAPTLLAPAIAPPPGDWEEARHAGGPVIVSGAISLLEEELLAVRLEPEQGAKGAGEQ